MEFGDLILVSQVNRVLMSSSPFKQAIDGTLGITGHQLILSSGKKGNDELIMVKSIKFFYYRIFKFFILHYYLCLIFR